MYILTHSPLTAALYYLNAWNRLTSSMPSTAAFFRARYRRWLSTFFFLWSRFFVFSTGGSMVHLVQPLGTHVAQRTNCRNGFVLACLTKACRSRCCWTIRFLSRHFVYIYRPFHQSRISVQGWRRWRESGTHGGGGGNHPGSSSCRSNPSPDPHPSPFHQSPDDHVISRVFWSIKASV